MKSQTDKAVRFRELHARPEILVMPNPWDAGTAKLLASLGFEALATTSLGRADGEGAVSREQVLANCRAIGRPRRRHACARGSPLTTTAARSPSS
jgi:2-methylisocitrate lyase-like PEP mutase family enzyme